MSSKKNELGPTQYNTQQTKCQYTLRQKIKKKWKTSKVQHTHVSFPHHYNRTRFYQKNMHEITILHRNFVCFSIFSEFTICQPILILQFHEKIDEQYPCKIFFKNICKFTICNINYHEKVICTSVFNIFWKISSKFIWFHPSRNNGFLKKNIGSTLSKSADFWLF